MKINKCAACGATDVDGMVCCSLFGAMSNSYCNECLSTGKDSYKDMVDYISCAGLWPDGINKEYQAVVREQLKLHNITEEQFIKDLIESEKECY